MAAAYAGYRLFLILGLTLLVGVVDSIGLSLFVPLLEIGVSDGASDSRISTIIFEAVTMLGVAPTMTGLLLLIAAIFLLKGVVTFGSTLAVAVMLVSVQERLRLEFVESARGTAYGYLLSTKVGKFANIFTTEIPGVMANVKSFVDLLNSSVMVVVYVAATVWVNWQVGVLAILFGVAVFAVFRRMNLNTREVSLSITEKNASIHNLVLQVLNQIKYLKATDSFGPLMARLRSDLDRRLSDFHKLYTYKTLISSSLEPLTVLCVVGFVLYMVEFRSMPVAESVLPLLFLYRSLGRVSNIQRSWNAFLASTGPVRAFGAVQDTLKEKAEVHGGGEAPRLGHGIQFENVSYAYEDRPTLSNVSLEIRRAETVGIVGATGAGKTTIVDMISGLLVPQSGDLYWDERRYSELDLRIIRKHIGYVLQSPVIFNDSIANNITLWREDGAGGNRVSPQLEAAAQAAQCLEFINETERGFDTVIGERGYRLSGGQQQRVAIAREIYRNPEVLIFDEGTSALDAATEGLIQDTLARLAGEKTIIVIAHRLATLKRCDRIYVLDKGRVTHSGSWDELSALPDSWFSQMLSLQTVS